MLSFELHKRKGPVRDTQGRVFTADAIMGNTFNIKSTLCKYASAMRGQAYTEKDLEQIKEDGGFDPESMLGGFCRLTIKHEQNKDGKTREKIDSISRLDPEDDKPPVGELDEVYWDWTQGTDVPKRIDYFWQRAAENPNRRSEPAPVGVGVGAGNGAHLIPAAGDDDIPY
jgi:hypothetical protein